MTEARKPYATVNGQWPAGTNEGRDIKPTGQEAIAATRRLYRKFMGKPWHGTFKLTSGLRYSYPKGSVYYVNPDWRGVGGWHEVVHFVSHVVATRLYGESHGPRHSFIEREMILHVVNSWWIDGRLRRLDRVKAPPDRRAQIEAAIRRWNSKRKRAETALKKLNRRLKYYERRAS